MKVRITTRNGRKAEELFELVVSMAEEGLTADAIHRRLLNSNLGEVVEWSYSPDDGPIFTRTQDFSPAYGGLAYVLKSGVQYLRRRRVEHQVIDEYEKDGRKYVAIWNREPCLGWVCIVYCSLL